MLILECVIFYICFIIYTLLFFGPLAGFVISSVFNNIYVHIPTRYQIISNIIGLSFAYSVEAFSVDYLGLFSGNYHSNDVIPIAGFGAFFSMVTGLCLSQGIYLYFTPPSKPNECETRDIELLPVQPFRINTGQERIKTATRLAMDNVIEMTTSTLSPGAGSSAQHARIGSLPPIMESAENTDLSF